MKKGKDFYIGWKDEMSADHWSVIKKFIMFVFVILPFLVITIIYAQKGFNNHVFEFGSSTELTDVYHSKPVPILEVTQGDLKEELSKHVLLVGYGKFGAEGIIEDIEETNGRLDGKVITIQGTLIYGDGKTLMELTNKSNSLIKIHEDNISSSDKATNSKPVVMTGEILDPKCYFGVMKPGEGKIHKSCAIRCISGGIPPVFRMKTAEDQNEYFIMLGEKAEKINDLILDKVGEEVRVSGQSGQLNGWGYLYLNPASIELVED